VRLTIYRIDQGGGREIAALFLFSRKITTVAADRRRAFRANANISGEV
jgi:hypothetical protein